jgi:T5SS/PEP-CTERM-associated repeat protein
MPQGETNMTTRYWEGGSGDWYSALLWSTPLGASGAPIPGDVALVNSGTVDISGTEEASIGFPVDAVQVTLGSATTLTPAVLAATDATFGHTFAIVSNGTAAYAGLDTTGPTGFSGTILADAAAGTFSINATLADGAQPGAFVLLHGGLINVSSGDDLVLTGSMVTDSSVTIAAGSTFTNDGVDRVFGGTTFIAPTATLTGTGTFEAGPGATLEFESAVPATQTITFGDAGRLDLSMPSTFDGQITSFVLGNTIDLLNTVANFASYDAASGLLMIENGSATLAVLAVQGPTSNLVLNTGTDGAGGTLITYPGSDSRTSYEIDVADQAVQANIVRQTMTTAAGVPIIGAGITIGIMSDSFNATLNGVVDPADTAARLGYLPETAEGTSAVTVLSDSTLSGVENEGLAMAELVHQIAPGAAIEFYTAEGGQDSFAQGVTALVDGGANIIVDDWGISNAPFYQIAGPVDTAVDNAISDGVDYFTSASNYGDAYYESTWQPVATQLVLQTGQPAQDVTAQQFSNGTQLQTITAPGSIATTIDLQWDAAWPVAGGSVPDPIAMALYTASGSLVATSSQVFASSSGYGYIPEISLSVPVTSTAAQYELAIYQVGTASVSQFKYILFGTPGTVVVASATLNDGSTVFAQDPGGTIDDPAAGQGSGDVHGQELVPGVNTVGAAYWSTSPAFGVSPDWTEYFSSVGPGELLFDQNGNVLATHESTGKVDFVAPDGIQTSVPGFQAFFGTSAASPDAAAVAALMLQADPNLTTSQVTSLLEQSAVSMDLPSADQGAGLIQATGAVQLALDTAATDRTLVWSGAGADNSFDDAENWVDTSTNLPASSPPGAGDTASFSSFGSSLGTITGTGEVASLQFANGPWTLASGTTLSDSVGVTVGSTTTGTLVIAGGATLESTGSADLIGTSGGSGTVFIGGPGAAWTSLHQLIVADSGTGMLDISDGGLLTDSGGISVGGSGQALLEVSNAGTVQMIGVGGIDIGISAGATGSLIVSGTSSVVTEGAASAGIAVGEAGEGLLEVANGGTASLAAGSFNIGEDGGSTGTVMVEGAGALLTTPSPIHVGYSGQGFLSVTNGGSLAITNTSNGNLDLGGSGTAPEGGTGTVVVSSGGSINAYAGLYVWSGSTLGVEAGSGVELGTDAAYISGTVSVSGGGASLTALGTNGGIGVGTSGSGLLDINSGGLVDANFVATGYNGTTGIVSVESGGTLINGNLNIGYTGVGSLVVSNGGAVVTNAGDVQVGQNAGASGYVVVTGDGSSITTLGTSGITVGGLGAGTLTVTDGGLVATSADLFISNGSSSSSGTVSVTGSGSSITALGTNGGIGVGVTGIGSLDINSDGLVNAGTAGIAIGYSDATGVVSVESGGTLSAGSISVGLGGTGSLAVTSGGAVEVTAGAVNIGQSLSGTGTVVVSGTGSSITTFGTSGVISVGDSGTGVLTITGGGSVSTSDDLFISGSGTTSSTVSVSGSGSSITALGTNGVIGVGVSGTGSLDINSDGLVNAGTNGIAIGYSGAVGIVSIENDGLLSAGNVSVGLGGTGSLAVTSGGAVEVIAGAVNIGQSLSGTGTVVVSGTGSSITTFGTSGVISVGDSGTGVLTITGGGSVSTSDDLFISGSGTTSSTVSVSGSGSSITALGTNGGIGVGVSGTGSLDINSDGLVNAGTNFVAVGYDGAVGIVSVESGGALLGGSLSIGIGGTALVSIRAGGTVAVTSVTVGQNGSLVLTGGVLDPASATLNGGGSVSGYGTLEADVGNASTMTASGGTLDVVGSITGSGTLVVSSDGNLMLDAGVGSGQQIDFLDSAGTLTLGNIGGFQATITQFTGADEIIVQTTQEATFNQNGSLVSVIASGSTLGVLTFANSSLASFAVTTSSALQDQLVSCFLAGTRIRTVRGEVKVEELGESDVAITGIDGSEAPVVWIGHREVDCARHPQPETVWPVRIGAGAFGRGLPKRVLTLSPDHAVYVNDVLVPVKHLINGTTIAQVPVERVTYYHVELDRHDVVYADGMPAESYLDVGDRANFANGGAVVQLHIDLAHHWEAGGCAPLVVYGAELEAVRALVAAQEDLLGNRMPRARARREARRQGGSFKRGHESTRTTRSAA